MVEPFAAKAAYSVLFRAEQVENKHTGRRAKGFRAVTCSVAYCQCVRPESFFGKNLGKRLGSAVSVVEFTAQS